tara:strand:+ start:1088 stop:2011 length:924 start_codon:yes stop_codon:yes gene_type:complete
MSIKDTVLASSPDLDKIIEKSVKRIGENHSLARDNKGVEMRPAEIEEDRKEWKETTAVIEESLKAVADEMAEKMVLENTIDNMVKDVLKNEKDNSTKEVKIEEGTKNTIKKLVKKKLEKTKNISEGSKVPGYDAYEKAVKKSKTQNDAAMKETEKKFKEYSDFEGNSNPEFPNQQNSTTDTHSPMYRNTTEDEEFVEDFAYPGLQDFDVHNQNMERLADYLEGSSETGNAQTDEDGKAVGNVVPSDLGEKMLKNKKRRKEKIDAQKASMTNLRGITPDVQKVKQVKEGVDSDIEEMKKLWSYNKKTQ